MIVCLLNGLPSGAYGDTEVVSDQVAPPTVKLGLHPVDGRYPCPTDRATQIDRAE